MSRHRHRALGLLAASPTMVGAITVLITVVSVFLAYNANSGLPFVASYRINAEVPNAASLVPGNEVRVGGVRVGIVESVEPIAHRDGSATARLGLRLDNTVRPIPKDSTLVIRARSALGLKYLEIDLGSSEVGVAEGSTIRLGHARPAPVELDQLLNTFDEPTRRGSANNLIEFGDALAGRGPTLNQALGDLAPLLGDLAPVARNLADRRTALGRFFDASGATAAEVAPVALRQLGAIEALEVSFAALASVARPSLQETIIKTPPTLDVANRALPRIRPFLRHLGGFFTDLTPGARALAAQAPGLNAALRIGVPALRLAPRLNDQLAPTAASLRAFNDDPAVRAGIRRLVQTGRELTPLARFVGPAQSVCNYGTLLLRNVGGLASLGDGLGTWGRVIALNPLDAPNNEGSPSEGPASGPDEANFLHVNPYPNTAAPGQTKECESGNEPYLPGVNVFGNVPGNQGTTTEEQP